MGQAVRTLEFPNQPEIAEARLSSHRRKLDYISEDQVTGDGV